MGNGRPRFDVFCGHEILALNVLEANAVDRRRATFPPVVLVMARTQANAYVAHPEGRSGFGRHLAPPCARHQRHSICSLA
jgi:hypothetical protein